MEKDKILNEKYALGKVLGKGNFAKVYYARNLETNESVAVKVIDKVKALKVGLDLQIKREISVMGKLRHKNVLKVHEVMATTGKVYIILEYAKGGELFNRVASGRFKEDLARRVFQQLISAVDFCHRKGVYHRDLKLENLLLDESGNLKVADFGLSMYVEPKGDDGRMLRTICGTPAYVAPEVISKRGYDGAKADIWSCGVILYAMLAGCLPFRDSNVAEMYKKMRKAQYKCPAWFPTEVHRLLSKILDPNPKTRISIEKIMESAWFRKGLGSKLINEPENVAVESDQEPRKLIDMNAFEIISMSSGFDLSGLFLGDDQREDVRFVSQQPASDIVVKLKAVAEVFGMKVVKKGLGLVMVLRLGNEKCDLVMLDVQVLEMTRSVHLVEMKKSGGDSLEYRKLMVGMKPALEEIVWSWQGSHNLQRKPEEVCLCEPL